MKIDFNYVMKVLSDNGIDQNYLDENDNWIESGTEEWMDVISDITGEDPYDMDEWEEEKFEKIKEFINVMEANGIEFY